MRTQQLRGHDAFQYDNRNTVIRSIAFDLLWLNGRDLRVLPLLERKRRLRALIPASLPHLIYADFVEEEGERLFQAVCDHDLQGVVAKRNAGLYIPEEGGWLKIKNPNYSQAKGRHDLFQKRRHPAYVAQ